MFETASFEIKEHRSTFADPVVLLSSVVPQMSKPALPFMSLLFILSSGPPSLSMSSAVGRLFWFQSDGPGVGGYDVSPSMDAAGVGALIELIGDNAEVSVLHDDVPGDGGQDLLAVFIPAGGNSKGKKRDEKIYIKDVCQLVFKQEE